MAGKVEGEYVVTSTGVEAFGLLEDHRPLVVQNNRAQTTLDSGKLYTLSWGMLGAPGGSLHIEFQSAEGDKVVIVDKSTIPAHRVKFADAADFVAP